MENIESLNHSIERRKEPETLGNATRNKLSIFFVRIATLLFKINLVLSLEHHVLDVAEKENEVEVASDTYDKAVAGQSEIFHIEHYYRPRYGLFRRRIERVTNALNPETGDVILDIGCGVGTFAYHSAVRGAHSIGVDYSIGSLRAAKKLAKKFGRDIKGSVRYVRATCTKLPFGSDTFDKIVCADFFEHITNKQKIETLSEMKRVLRVGGKMVIYTPNRNLQILYIGLLRLFAVLRGKDPSKHTLESLDSGHIGLMTPAEMKKLLKRENLDFKIRLFSREFTSSRILNSFADFASARIPLVNQFLSERILAEVYKN
jgi:ubiquinone/menaquinone biosynthesis C-methylase UbiE